MAIAANINTQSSHGGSDIGSYISDASGSVNIGGAPADKLGTVYNCPHTGHGNKPVANGSSSVNINGVPVANQNSLLTCGAALDTNNVTSVVIGG